uniref:Mitochondrial inner membrane protease ATP23 n=1 Tax=Macrostomum lignano TaxID=282301 RepID=A0A1I8JNT6_9PLAT
QQPDCAVQQCGQFSAAPDPCVTLRHELVHAFDACRAVADFDSSLDQLACTEVSKEFFKSRFRAYNLAEPASWQKPAGWSRPTGPRAAVRQRRVDSVLTAEAETAVNRVFDRCYADLEPFGRRPLPPDPLERAELGSAQLAAKEAKFYGYWSECQSSS